MAGGGLQLMGCHLLFAAFSLILPAARPGVSDASAEDRLTMIRPSGARASDKKRLRDEEPFSDDVEDEPTCILERMSLRQLEARLRDVEDELAKTRAELATASKDDLDLIDVNTFIGRKEILQRRIEELKAEKQTAPAWVVYEEEVEEEGSVEESNNKAAQNFADQVLCVESDASDASDSGLSSQLSLSGSQTPQDAAAIVLAARVTRSNAHFVKANLIYPRLSALPRIWHDYMDLWELVPPMAPPRSLSNANAFYDSTEDIGRYLIKRGFPLLQHGSHSLVFLLDEHHVAKVAKDRTILGVGTHLEERNKDLLWHRNYPTCFAETRLNIVSDGQGLAHRLYVQERLYGEFHYGGIEPSDFPQNAFMISKMLTENPHAQLKQWAWTRHKRMATMTHGGYEVEVDARWLVCFDYQ